MRRPSLSAALAAALLAASAGAARAQDAAPAPADAAARPAATPEARPAGTDPAVGDPAVGDIVRVRLRSGRSVEGVVLAKGAWERRDPARGWIGVPKSDRGAGVRLWFTSDLQGYQWVAVSDVTKIEVVGKSTDASRRDAEVRRAEEAKRTEEARRRADEAKTKAAEAELRAKAEDLAADVAKAKAGAEAALAAAKKSDEAKAARWAELLSRFPPDRWTPETPKEIERRKVVMHLFPSDDEQAFLEVYSEWAEAWAGWKKAQADAKDAK